MIPREPFPVVLGLLAALLGAVAYAGDLALQSLSDRRLEALAAAEPALAARFGRARKDREKILSRWLVLRVAGISIAAVMLSAAAQEALGSSFWRALIFAVLGSVLTYGTLAETIGTVARRRSEGFAAFALKCLLPLEWLVIPVAAPLAWIGDIVGSRVTEKRSTNARITENEVEFAVAEGERSGAIGEEPAEMIRNVLEFKDLTVREVMVPRTRVCAIELNTALSEVLHIVSTEGHSRYPVYQETLDNVVGLLYAKDLFELVESGALDANKQLADVARKPALLAISSQSTLSVLREMRGRRQHLAIVADEFGGTEGIVTLEDILEEIVGDIKDEYDTELAIVKLAEGRFLADAAIPISDLEPFLGNILDGEDGDYESLGGFLVHRAGRVPAIGAVVSIDTVDLIVREADDTHIVKVEIVRRPKALETASS